MLPVGGQPMIERVLGHLAGHGIDEAVLSLGYRPDAFMDSYPGGKCAGVALTYVVEDAPLDTAGAIRFAARQAQIAETFVVVNGDVLTELDVSALVHFHQMQGAEATIALTPVPDPSAFGVVPTDGDGRVLAFIEKPHAGRAPTNLINAGTYVLEPSVLTRIPGARRVSVERETFPALVADGRLFAQASDADWVDAGTPSTFLAANLRYATDSPGAWPDASVTASVIAPDVTVGPGAVIDRSVLFTGVTVGRGVEIRSSIVGRDARVEPGAVVSDLSIVGDGTVVPPRSRLSGARVPVAP
jgi:mannose-1-phosphate guanylyltransferase